MNRNVLSRSWFSLRATGVLTALLSVLLTATRNAKAVEETSSPPNIVFILADDLGWTDLGCYGSKFYQTPNIDRLAAQGMRFTDGYTCGPNCQPTRAALLSGQYGPRTGVYTVGSRDRFNWQSQPVEPPENVQALNLEIKTLADTLKTAGYVTGMFGKWHLGNGPRRHPGARGFDEAIASSGRHFDFQTSPEVDVPEGDYLTDFLTDKAVDFLQRHKDETFFLYLPHFAVHSPFQAKQEKIEQAQEWEPASGHNDPVYAAMIASLDESVGRVLDTIDELGLAESTLILFSSDNGGVGGYGREGITSARNVTDNDPLRSGKGSLYEGGIRVPWIARWSGKVQPGSICNVPIISVDLYPTLLELSGAEAPRDQPLDGLSILPLILGKTDKLDRDSIYWHFPGYLGSGQNQWRTRPVGAVRDGDWKLLEFFEDGRLELYNLREDMSESQDQVSTQPDQAKALQQKLESWRRSINAVMPKPQNVQG